MLLPHFLTIMLYWQIESSRKLTFLKPRLIKSRLLIMLLLEDASRPCLGSSALLCAGKRSPNKCGRQKELPVYDAGPWHYRKGCLCCCTWALIGLSAEASRIKWTDLNIRSLLGLNIPHSYEDLASKILPRAFSLCIRSLKLPWNHLWQFMLSSS